MNDILINPNTQNDINNFLKSDFPCLAIIGSTGSGKEYLAQKTILSVIDKDLNKSGAAINIIDGKKAGIDNVRELQKKLYLTSATSVKVGKGVVIANFDSFGHEAQNALLKTLEEPPLDALIIITINNENKVLPTIYSRVKKIYLRSVNLNQAISYFDPNFTEEQIAKAYKVSLGDPGLLVNLLRDAENHPLVLGINNAKDLIIMSKSQRIAEVDKITKSKDNDTIANLLDAMMRIFSASHAAAIDKNANNTFIKQSYFRLSKINQANKDLQTGLSKKLILTDLFMNI